MSQTNLWMKSAAEATVAVLWLGWALAYASGWQELPQGGDCLVVRKKFGMQSRLEMRDGDFSELCAYLYLCISGCCCC